MDSTASLSTTPESRQTYTRSGISTVVKDRVRAVDPNAGRCLIENKPERFSVQFCHCIARSNMQDDSLLDRLEWNWNLQRGTLNLDTRYNIFRAGSDLYTMYDRGLWLLLPEDALIQQYFNVLTSQNGLYFATRATFPNIPNGDFFYRLIPVHSMEGLAINRQNEIPPGTQLSSDDVISHVSPFQTLPLLKSHIHPKFAIFEAGRKLTTGASGYLFQLTRDYPCLSHVLILYSAWLRDAPPGAEQDETYVPLQKESDDDEDYDCPTDEDHTSVGRPHRNKRGASHTSKPTKRKRTNQAGSTVTRTLAEIQRDRKFQKLPVSSRIRQWVGSSRNSRRLVV